jgi:hypothetical protein
MLAVGRYSLMILSLLMAFPAMAQDDDGDLFGEDPEEEEDDGVPIPSVDDDDDFGEVDDSDLDSSIDQLDDLVGTEAETVQINLGLGDDDDDPEGPLAPGQDSATIYRQQLAQLEGLGADEEGMAWEEYLQTYPASVFRKQIEDRMAEISMSMYGGGQSEKVDERNKEMHFSQPMLMESIDPRTKLRAGFEWGFPDWINLVLDYEQQLQRQLSVHGGIQHRYTGWSLEGGARYALIKSTRTNMIVTAIGDVHINVNPVAPGFRPVLAAGKRLDLPGDVMVDIQAQAGMDMMLYSTGFSPRMLWGLNTTVAPSDTISIFLETTSYAKDLFWDEGNAFRFNQFSFGLRVKGKGNTTSGAGASVPVSTNYWKYHYGSVIGDFNYYL